MRCVSVLKKVYIKTFASVWLAGTLYFLFTAMLVSVLELNSSVLGSFLSQGMEYLLKKMRFLLNGLLIN